MPTETLKPLGPGGHAHLALTFPRWANSHPCALALLRPCALAPSIPPSLHPLSHPIHPSTHPPLSTAQHHHTCTHLAQRSTFTFLHLKLHHPRPPHPPHPTLLTLHLHRGELARPTIPLHTASRRGATLANVFHSPPTRTLVSPFPHLDTLFPLPLPHPPRPTWL